MADNPFARYVTDAAQKAAHDAWCDYWGDPGLLDNCSKCNGTGLWHDGNCDLCGGCGGVHVGTEEDACRAAIRAALAIVGPEIRREERERCAAVAEGEADWPENIDSPTAALRNEGRNDAAREIAAAIRALGKEG